MRTFYQAIAELEQPTGLNEAYEQIEKFVMGRVKTLFLSEMSSVLTPFDSTPLKRLLDKFQLNVTATRKYDKIYSIKDQPRMILRELIDNPFYEQTFKIQNGLTFRKFCQTFFARFSGSSVFIEFKAARFL